MVEDTVGSLVTTAERDAALARLRPGSPTTSWRTPAPASPAGRRARTRLALRDPRKSPGRSSPGTSSGLLQENRRPAARLPHPGRKQCGRRTVRSPHCLSSALARAIRNTSLQKVPYSSTRSNISFPTRQGTRNRRAAPRRTPYGRRCSARLSSADPVRRRPPRQRRRPAGRLRRRAGSSRPSAASCRPSPGGSRHGHGLAGKSFSASSTSPTNRTCVPRSISCTTRAEKCARLLGHVGQAGGVERVLAGGELVQVVTAVEAEGADELHGRILCQARGREAARSADDAGGGVPLVQRHAHLQRRRGYLLERVGHAAGPRSASFDEIT